MATDAVNRQTCEHLQAFLTACHRPRRARESTVQKLRIVETKLQIYVRKLRIVETTLQTDVQKLRIVETRPRVDARWENAQPSAMRFTPTGHAQEFDHQRFWNRSRSSRPVYANGAKSK